jgi:hypothetical protein
MRRRRINFDRERDEAGLPPRAADAVLGQQNKTTTDENVKTLEVLRVLIHNCILLQLCS